MGRNHKWLSTSETLAIGIEVNRHSLCGAMKRFELNGKQWNGLHTLKEQCARRIALIKNKQIKCLITAYLSSDLFKYVTEDIFDLQRDEFTLKYAKPLYMCQECTMATYEKPSDDCQCPQMDNAIDALNNCLFKQSNNQKTRKRFHDDDSKQFQLIYKIPNDELDHSYELHRPTSCFLYLSPSQYDYKDDTYRGPFDEYNLIDSQISVEEKFLFVDAMRFFGGFQTDYQEPRLILYRRREFPL